LCVGPFIDRRATTAAAAVTMLATGRRKASSLENNYLIGLTL